MKRNLPCEFHIEDAVYAGTTVDVTEHRLLVQCDDTFSPGTDVEVRIPAIGDISEFWIKTRVARGADHGPRQIALLVVEAPPVYKVLTMPGLEIGASIEGARLGCQPSTFTDKHDSKQAVLVDDGSLAPLATLLDSLDVEYAHITPAHGRIASWPTPERLFVCSARLAFALPMPSLMGNDRLVGIAVAETATQTLVRNVQLLGFQYLVSLPVHPEALRLLLQESLFRAHERRATPRCPVGVPIFWRSGLRRQHATLIEISESGARLHMATPVDLDSILRFTVPAAASRGPSLRLRGRVVRRERRRGVALAEPYTVALRWEQLGARSVARLDDYLRARSVGPATFDGPGAARPIAQASISALSIDPLPQDRRQTPRAVLEGEVVSLNDANAVEHVLVCRDLSRTGMRVDPHPSIREGAELRIALLDSNNPAPLLLDAEVDRDAADVGLGLRFRDVSGDAASRLQAWVERLPKLPTLQPQPRRVVFGRIVERDG
jgi:hypothetical protein